MINGWKWISWAIWTACLIHFDGWETAWFVVGAISFAVFVLMSW